MLSINAFSGETPRLSPRLIPQNAATVARNCVLIDGDIAPVRRPLVVRTAGVDTVSFQKFDQTWLEWDRAFQAVPAPVARNRLYATGADGGPKLIVDGSVVFDLKLPGPGSAIAASVIGTPVPETQETYVYTYTYVTAYDEESEPAPVSNEVLRSPGMDVTLADIVLPPSSPTFPYTNARNITRIRLYRSQTSTSGVTGFFLFQEIEFYAFVGPIAGMTTRVDTVEGVPIQGPLPSMAYNMPPDDLKGIISLPNGMLAAYSGKKLYFSEPYVPHAWPEKYILTADYDIMGLGAFGQSVVIATSGMPYVATGLSPETMVLERLEVNLPCVGSRSVVDLGSAVAYASPYGLVVVSSQGASLATKGLMTTDQWAELSPESFIAAQYDGRYIASFSSAGAVRSIIQIDLTGAQPFISYVDLVADDLFFEVGSGLLYIKTGQNIGLWHSPESEPLNARWRSKIFRLTGPVSFGAILVDGSPYEPPAVEDPDVVFSEGSLTFTLYPGSNNNSVPATPYPAIVPFEASVYADGALIRTITQIGVVERLPAGFQARQWEIEVRGVAEINSIIVASSPSELAAR